MRWSKYSPHMSLVVVVLLALLLAAFATLQYRWIAQLSEAERGRLERGLEQATAGFCRDFDHEVARTFTLFAVEQTTDDAELSSKLAERLSEWRSTATWPGLVRELAVIRLDDEGEISALCFDEQSKSLNPCDWGEERLPVRRPRDSGPRVPVIDGDLPGLIVAIEKAVSQTGKPLEWRPPRDHLIVPPRRRCGGEQHPRQRPRARGGQKHRRGPQRRHRRHHPTWRRYDVQSPAPCPAEALQRKGGMTMNPRLLLVEDEASLALTLSDRLQAEGLRR